jgi:flagellar motor protein MotB
VRWYTDRGVDASRLSAIGRGATEPAAPNDTSEGRQMNSRIEVTITNLLEGSE